MSFAHLRHVLGGVLFITPALTRDAVGISSVTMRAGAETEIVAAAPVIHIMARMPPGPGVVGNLVALQSRVAELHFDGLRHGDLFIFA